VRDFSALMQAKFAGRAQELPKPTNEQSLIATLCAGRLRALREEKGADSI